MAKGKIKTIEVKKNKNGEELKTQKGDFICKVVFEDGTVGDAFLNSPTKYKVGEEVDYTYTAPTKEELDKYQYAVGKIKFENKGGFGGGFKQQDPKIQIAIAAVRMSSDLVGQKVIEIADAKKTAKYFFNMINELAGLNAPEAQNSTPKQ